MLITFCLYILHNKDTCRLWDCSHHLRNHNILNNLNQKFRFHMFHCILKQENHFSFIHLNLSEWENKCSKYMRSWLPFSFIPCMTYTATINGTAVSISTIAVTRTIQSKISIITCFIATVNKIFQLFSFKFLFTLK